MELNKEYKVSEYPLEELKPGTIIKGLTYGVGVEEIDIIIITESKGVWDNDQFIVGVDTNGLFYTNTHNLLTYEILRFKK